MKVQFPSASRRGVALVITLVLLSIITFMAIAFLVLSRGEKSSVTTTTEQTMAKLAADTGFERAKAMLVAPVVAFSNEFRFDLLVSTNYINRNGFNPLPDGLNYDAVSFAYGSGFPVTGNDFLRVLTNLLYSPRVPVYVAPDRSTAPDFRYYLDLNRNNRYDTNGWLPAMSGDLNFPFYDTNGFKIPNVIPGNTWSNFYTGDPEWIGVLERPGYPHSSSNKFVARYAYVVVPEGKTLDLNAAHDYAKMLRPRTMDSGDGHFRNQGVGPWEINLAAFLVDLNTNYWPYPVNNLNGTRYNYSWDLGQPNTGTAFDDALSLLRYRYAGNMQQNLGTVRQLFGERGVAGFQFDFLDGYTRGPLMTSNSWGTGVVDLDRTRVDLAWSGSPAPNRFFTTQELFDDAKILRYAPSRPPVTFSDRLRWAGTNNNSYDRYTYYRLLAQLGTESAPEAPGRMNLNYNNLAKFDRAGDLDVDGRASATNFVPWLPTGIDFFTNAAARLLAGAGFTFGITNIQLYPTNCYTPSVHRLLQLAANMFDATTNRLYGSGTNNPGMPSVFRPIFGKSISGTETVISIVGYDPVIDASLIAPSTIKRDLHLKSDRDALQPLDLVYGVPLVIGAKKGLPNFNEFAAQTVVQVTRKLEFRRGADGRVNETNQMYVVGITNVFGLEAWNSYSNPFPHALRLVAQAEVFAFMTNQAGLTLVNQVHRPPFFTSTIAANTWPGYTIPSYERFSFQVPYDPETNFAYFLPFSTWQNIAPNLFIPLTGNFERHSGFPTPKFFLNLRTRVSFALQDLVSNRIVDYVMLDSVEDTIDIAAALADGGACGDNFVVSSAPGSYWCTNVIPSGSVTAPNFGVRNHIAVCMGLIRPPEDQWRNFTPILPPEPVRQVAQTAFNKALLNPDVAAKDQVFYTPYDPMRTIFINTTWQANDPLVHYTIGDLVALIRTNRLEMDHTVNPPISNIRRVNGRYEPWTADLVSGSTSLTRYELSLKDPLVSRSDDWDFPTNKFPNIGWLGRVHRGTPWQTVYLKAPLIDAAAWKLWTGNPYHPINYWQLETNRLMYPARAITNLFAHNGDYDDALLTLPVRDRELFDQFTTSFSEPASRGRLSINQTNLAAWSAVLAGVIVLSNNVTDAQLIADPFLRPTNTWLPIQPAGTVEWTQNLTNWPAMARIVKGINDYRASNPTNYPSRVFGRLGEILGTPELTIASPFLNTNTAAQKIRAISDAAYERIPQQIMGLLASDPEPHFVVYSFGQSLKPADRSIVTSGPYFGLCTNYQVTAEVATRAVVRVQSAPNQPKIVVENYNSLPPD
jgi:hypothetical protein